MIIEASNTYFGGGYVLLEELLDSLEQRGIEATVYLGYEKVYEALCKKRFRHIILKRSNALNTLLRYLERRKNVLYFCSLPPFRKNERSIVYAHNPHFIVCPKRLNKYLVYYYWTRIFRNKTDFFACQTDGVADKLKAMGCRIRLMPFYVNPAKIDLPAKYDFCYISTVAPHKNHGRLFDAVEKLVMQGRRFTLAVTIRDDAKNAGLIERLNRINSSARMPVIINRGFVPKTEVTDILCSSRTAVFPSLKETFGLPIAEALSCGLRVLSADRSYTHDLIDCPIVFDPEDSDSIARTLAAELDGKFDMISQQLKIQDQLEELIGYFNE